MEFKRNSLLLVAILLVAILAAGCTPTTTLGNPAPVQIAQPAAALPAAGTSRPCGYPNNCSDYPSCPDKEVLTGSWDSREVGYASNHDVRETGVWTDASPVPLSSPRSAGM